MERDYYSSLYFKIIENKMASFSAFEQEAILFEE